MPIERILYYLAWSPPLYFASIIISAMHHYLNTYTNRVWDLLESFLAIDMIVIPRKYNQITDALNERGARLNLVLHKRGAHRVKVICRPCIPDTTNYWKIFEFDEHIMNFLMDKDVAYTFGVQELSNYF